MVAVIVGMFFGIAPIAFTLWMRRKLKSIGVAY